jgi:hypothetical protein
MVTGGRASLAANATTLTRDHSRYRLLNDRRVAAIVVFAINGVQDTYCDQCSDEGFHRRASPSESSRSKLVAESFG